MNYRLKVLSILFLITASASFARAQTALPVKDVEAIKAVQAAYRQAWLRNDETAILSAFTDDAVFFPNGGSPVRGKAAIRKFWFAPSATVTTITRFDDEIEEVIGEGDLAAVTGTNIIYWTTEDKAKKDTKKFIGRSTFVALVVRRATGWKIYKQFWNSKTEEVK